MYDPILLTSISVLELLITICYKTRQRRNIFIYIPMNVNLNIFCTALTTKKEQKIDTFSPYIPSKHFHFIYGIYFTKMTNKSPTQQKKKSYTHTAQDKLMNISLLLYIYLTFCWMNFSPFIGFECFMILKLCVQHCTAHHIMY